MSNKGHVLLPPSPTNRRGGYTSDSSPLSPPRRHSYTDLTAAADGDFGFRKMGPVFKPSRRSFDNIYDMGSSAEFTEKISAVTIKARRMSTPASESITLYLTRKYSQTKLDESAENGWLELSASAKDADEVVICDIMESRKRVESPETQPTDSGAQEKESSPNSEFLLENEWTFWFEEMGPRHAPKIDSDRILKELGSFKTVQGFWGYWNNLHIESMRENFSLCLFKQGIKPLWEDPANRNGGKWILRNVPKCLRVKLWSKVVMLMIGEQLDDSDDLVCGTVFSARDSGDVIQLWTDGGYVMRMKGDPAGLENQTSGRVTMSQLLHKYFHEDTDNKWTFHAHRIPDAHRAELNAAERETESAESLRELGHIPKIPSDVSHGSVVGSSITVPHSTQQPVPIIVTDPNATSPKLRPASPAAAVGRAPLNVRVLSPVTSPALGAKPPPHAHAGIAMDLSGSQPMPHVSLSPSMRPQQPPEVMSPVISEGAFPDIGSPPLLPASASENMNGMTEEERKYAMALEVQRRILNRKVTQISYLLDIYERVRENPSDPSLLLSDILRPTLVMSPPHH